MTLFEQIRAIIPSILDSIFFSTMPKIAFSFRSNVLHDDSLTPFRLKSSSLWEELPFKRISVILCFLIWNSDQNTDFFFPALFHLITFGLSFQAVEIFRELSSGTQ